MIQCMQSIFLSHSHADKAFAKQLSEALLGHGIATWLDEAEIQVGDSLIQKIEVAIRDCTYLGVILSPDSVGSEWVRREVEIALNEEIYGRRVKVLPLLYKPCKLPGFLTGKLYADFSGDFAVGFAKLLAKLNSDLQSTTQRGAHLRELFLSRFQTWASFGHQSQDLLQNETLMQALDSTLPSSVSVDMLTFLFSSMCQVIHRSTPVDPEWIRWIDEVSHSVTIAALGRVLESDIPKIRTGAAKISGLVQANTTLLLLEKLTREQNIETKRHLIQGLDLKAGMSAELATSLAYNEDWIIRMYAAKKKSAYLALLISDGIRFAMKIGEIAASSGFHVISTSGFSIP